MFDGILLKVSIIIIMYNVHKVWFTVLFHYLTRSSDVLNGVVSGGCLFDNLQMYCDVSLKKSSWSTTSGRQAASWASQKSTNSWGIVSPSLPQSTLRTVRQTPPAQTHTAPTRSQLVCTAPRHVGRVFTNLPHQHQCHGKSQCEHFNILQLAYFSRNIFLPVIF